MAETLLEILSPNGLFFKKEVYMVTMPGVKGELGVCYGHAPWIVILQQGIVKIYNSNEEVLDYIFIGGGFVEITKATVTILVEEASSLKDYNLNDVKAKLLELDSTSKEFIDDIEIDLLEKEQNKYRILLEFLER